jgi:hypothetical protein
MTEAGQSASSKADAAGTRNGLGNHVIVEPKAVWRRKHCGEDMPVGPPEARQQFFEEGERYLYVYPMRDVCAGVELRGLEMGFDRKRLMEIFEALGGALAKPTTICVIGSSPGIALGQPERQTPDIDVWRQESSYDESAFQKACEQAGVLFDPRGEHLDPDVIYVQVIRKGIVNLPPGFGVELVGEFGSLRVVMPDPSLLVAAKLARGTPRDVEDAAWWMRERALTADDIRRSIGALPDPVQRETASENVVLVELVGSERRPK